MKRQFQHTYTVRYDEADSNGNLTPAAFLRYMQDIAALDARNAQLAGDGYWVVKRTILSFTTPLPMHTELAMKTYGLGFTRITAQRGYEASIAGKGADDPVLSARTLWVYVDGRGRPTRMPPETAQIWLPDGPVAQQAEAAWHALPTSEPERSTYRVRYADIDSMKHMNNAAYVEVLDNAAWEAYYKMSMTPDAITLYALDYDIEYAESARFGEILEVQTWLDPLPSAGKEFTRFQQIKRGETVLVRARSRWFWNK